MENWKLIGRADGVTWQNILAPLKSVYYPCSSWLRNRGY
jgi:hypothetical protein